MLPRPSHGSLGRCDGVCAGSFGDLPSYVTEMSGARPGSKGRFYGSAGRCFGCIPWFNWRNVPVPCSNVQVADPGTKG